MAHRPGNRGCRRPPAVGSDLAAGVNVDVVDVDVVVVVDLVIVVVDVIVIVIVDGDGDVAVIETLRSFPRHRWASSR